MNPDLEWEYSYDFYYLMVVFITLFALVAVVCFYTAATATNDTSFAIELLLGAFAGAGTLYAIEELCRQLILLQIPPVNYFKASKFTRADNTPAEEGQATLETFDEVKT